MIEKKHTTTSKFWLKEHFNDKYVQQAHQKGLRSRSWFKIAEIQQKEKLFKPGMTVIDLGATPGGWSQYVIQQIGKMGKVIACDILPMNPIIGVEFLQGDFRSKLILKKLFNTIDNNKVQVVMSDMSPNICGIPEIDIPRAFYLVELALKICLHTLTIGGSFIVKVFHGEGFEKCLKNIYPFFKKVKVRKPNSSQKHSREVYVIATGRGL